MEGGHVQSALACEKDPCIGPSLGAKVQSKAKTGDLNRTFNPQIWYDLAGRHDESSKKLF